MGHLETDCPIIILKDLNMKKNYLILILLMDLVNGIVSLKLSGQKKKFHFLNLFSINKIELVLTLEILFVKNNQNFWSAL